MHVMEICISSRAENESRTIFLFGFQLTLNNDTEKKGIRNARHGNMYR
jgi:hypothetical protein